MNKAKPYIYKKLSKYLVYDETSSTLLRWKIDRKTPFGVKCKKGDEAGTINKSNNTYYVSVENKSYIVYRVIWSLINKKDVPVDLVVDHIDGNRQNNHPDNLQLLTHSQNMQKRKVRHDSKTGLKGISFNEDIECYSVGISSGNERRFRDFYLSDYATADLALQAAIDWRHKMEDELHDVSERNRII